MRRKDRERDAAFAWQVLRDAPYGTLALDDDGAPYCVPINHVAVEAENAVYFHCAGAGKKWALLEREPMACFSAVSYAALVPEKLTTNYDSAILRAQVELITDEAEKRRVLSLLTAALDPIAAEKGIVCGAESMKNVRVVKLAVTDLTAKQARTE